MVGSIKETMDMNMHVINDLFTKTASYLMAKHNFYLNQDNQQYNGYMHHLRDHLEGHYNLPPDHFIFYFENLFRIISPALAQIPERIINCTTITTDLGEIEGFVFGT